MKQKINPLKLSIKVLCTDEFKIAKEFFERLGYKLGFAYVPSLENKFYYGPSFVFLNHSYKNCIDSTHSKYYDENLEVTIPELLKWKVIKIKQSKWKNAWKGNC